VSHGLGHQVLHVAILASTLMGAGGLVLLVIWPLVSETPLPSVTRNILAGIVILAILLLGLEWRVVH
jgi:hypothetical protein